MIKLTEADKILKNTYLYLANERTSGKKAKLQTEKVVCLKCGRSNKTLLSVEKINYFERARLKLAKGYICNNCLKELQNER